MTLPGHLVASHRHAMRLGRPRAWIARGILALVGLGCGSEKPMGPPTPSAVTVVSGDAQMGAVAAILPQKPTVRVTGSGGAIAGVIVTFAITSGGGTATPPSVTTDVNGLASTNWILGGASGPQSLTASVAGLSPAVFSAQGLAGPVANLTQTSGNSQQATVGKPLPFPLAVRVTDAFGNPKPNQAVTFTVTEGGGTIAGGAQTTGADGTASSGVWTLGPVAGFQRVVASAGATIFAIFVATATPVPPAVFTAVSIVNQTANAGTLVATPPMVEARDSTGNPMPGVSVTFTVTAGGGSVLGGTQTTDAQGRATVGGWILGTAPGPNTLNAAVFGNPPVAFSATGVAAVPTAISVVSGNAQTVFRGNLVPTSPKVRVVDGGGRPVANTVVTFTPGPGSGVVRGPPAATDFDGIAGPVVWRLGPTVGPQTLVASVTGGLTIDISATGQAPPASQFNIEVQFSGTPPTPAQQAAFDNAVARWTNLILNDLPDVTPTSAGGGCPIPTSPVDDVLIFAELVPIDGVGGILGAAGPCTVRASNGLTITGIMRFDTADLASLAANGTLEPVILHEMAHVLGIGTRWEAFGLIQGKGGPNPTYTGPGGVLGLKASVQPGGDFNLFAVLVENTGGTGTRDGHWREVTYTTELLTGFIDASNQLSLITAGSLRDFGYVVDDTFTDTYSFLSAVRAATAAPMQLREVPLEGKILVIDHNGRTIALIPRE